MHYLILFASSPILLTLWNVHAFQTEILAKAKYVKMKVRFIVLHCRYLHLKTSNIQLNLNRSLSTVFSVRTTNVPINMLYYLIFYQEKKKYSQCLQKCERNNCTQAKLLKSLSLDTGIKYCFILSKKPENVETFITS